MRERKKMSWRNVCCLTLGIKVFDNVLPIRMSLTRTNGSTVTSGGLSIPEAAVTLFSTAGLGRVPPPILAERLKNLFRNQYLEEPYKEIIESLLAVDNK